MKILKEKGCDDVKKAIAIIIATCLALTMLNACGGKSDKSRVLDRVNNFFESYNENDAYKMMQCFADREQYADTTYEDVKELLEQMDCDLYTYEKIARVKVESVGFPTIKEAFVSLDLYLEDGEESVKWYIKMKKEGASWYIHTMYGK